MPQIFKRKREDGIVDAIASERESAFAAWGRIAMRTVQPGSVKLPPFSLECESLFYHEPLDAGGAFSMVDSSLDKTGWICLQINVGYTWVPDHLQRMRPLFLFPACVFPSPGVEYNILCPECIQSNKKMMRNFERKYKTLRSNLSL